MDRLYALSENARRKIPIRPYLFAFLITLIAIAVRSELVPTMGTGSSLLIFYLAVILSGWHGGMIPVLITTALSISLNYIFFTEPLFQLTYKGPEVTTRIILFAMGAIIFGFISESRLRREKRIETLLKETISAKKRVEKSLVFRDNFISIASHELKTPLATASLILQVLYRKTTNKKTFVHLKNLKGQLDKLAQLINDFLDISKIQNGKLQIEKERVDMNKLVRDVVKLARLTVSSHKIYLRGKLSGNIIGDKERLSQVIVNLISNASKYSPPGSKIIVSLKDLREAAMVSVRDYGIGIKPENQQRIFKRFFRVEGKNEHIFRGFGIGLYICTEIIKRHKGKIWVESKVGEGSTFSFTIPKVTT